MGMRVKLMVGGKALFVRHGVKYEIVLLNDKKVIKEAKVKGRSVFFGTVQLKTGDEVKSVREAPNAQETVEEEVDLYMEDKDWKG